MALSYADQLASLDRQISQAQGGSNSSRLSGLQNLRSKLVASQGSQTTSSPTSTAKPTTSTASGNTGGVSSTPTPTASAPTTTSTSSSRSRLLQQRDAIQQAAAHNGVSASQQLTNERAAGTLTNSLNTKVPTGPAPAVTAASLITPSAAPTGAGTGVGAAEYYQLNPTPPGATAPGGAAATTPSDPRKELAENIAQNQNSVNQLRLAAQQALFDGDAAKYSALIAQIKQLGALDTQYQRELANLPASTTPSGAAAPAGAAPTAQGAQGAPDAQVGGYSASGSGTAGSFAGGVGSPGGGALASNGLTPIYDLINSSAQGKGTGEQALALIQQQIIDLMQPSTEEQDLLNKLNNEINGLELGKNNIQDQAIPLGFITGQQASIERRALARITPLQKSLETITELRKARLESMQQLGQFQEGSLAREFQQSQFQYQQQRDAIAQKQAEFNNQIALATKGLRYDESTGEFYRDPTLAEPTDPVERAKLEEALRKEFNGLKRVENYNELAAQVGKMEAAYGEYQKTGQGANFVDQALITIFNKINDPGSVVRESEFARTAQGLSVLQAIDSKIVSLAKGGVLNNGAREELLSVARAIFNVEQSSFNELADRYTAITESNGLAVENVIFRPSAGAVGASSLSDRGVFGKISQDDIEFITQYKSSLPVDQLVSVLKDSYGLTTDEVIQFLDSL